MTDTLSNRLQRSVVIPVIAVGTNALGNYLFGKSIDWATAGVTLLSCILAISCFEALRILGLRWTYRIKILALVLLFLALALLILWLGSFLEALYPFIIIGLLAGLVPFTFYAWLKATERDV